jgi:hypothetical protein
VKESLDREAFASPLDDNFHRKQIVLVLHRGHLSHPGKLLKGLRKAPTQERVVWG